MTDGPLNISVEAEPATCRASAKSLDGLSKGSGSLVDAFGKSADESEFWVGETGEAFRGVANNAKDNSHQVEQNAERLSRALTEFADEIDTVKNRLQQAARVCSDVGLTVTDKLIQPPGQAPGPAPESPGADSSPEQKQQHQHASSAHQAAAADFQRKQRAFNEASATVSEARGKERAAHDKLRKGASETDESTSALQTAGRQALTTSVSLVGGLSAASLKLVRSADKSMHLATLATALRANPNMTSAQQAMLNDAQKALYKQAAKDGFQNGQLNKVIDKLPDGLKSTLAYNVSDAVNDMRRAGRGVPKSLMTDIRGLKRLPVVGNTLTVGLAGVDIANGADPAKTSEKAAGSIAAGVGVAALADAGVAGLAGAGLAVPGPGWVAAGVALGSAAAAYGVGKAVDAWGDDINNAVGDAANKVGDFFGSTF